MHTVYSISAFNDNYIWVLVNEVDHETIVVDPGDATPVLKFFREKKLALRAILITHKHYDHVNGIAELLSAFPSASVFANHIENVAHTTHSVKENDVVNLHESFRVIEIPGHTLGHIAYYRKPFLFCGDTLFANGCGKIFEGTPAQMLASLKKLMALPDDTKIYCGHEYTISNIEFALKVEKNNFALQKRYVDAKKLRAENVSTLPSTIKLEKETNPFLRCTVSEIIHAVSQHAGKSLRDEVDVFAELRAWKNIT